MSTRAQAVASSLSSAFVRAGIGVHQAPRPLGGHSAAALSRPASLSTGISELDALLAGGGIPRGRLTEVVGARGSGKTTVLRQLVGATAARGLWVAYIDAARTLAPRDWAHVGGEEPNIWMVRPNTPGKGAWCADILLRSGAFALVVLDSGPPLKRSVGVRLTRLAREAGAAFVVVIEDDTAVSTGVIRPEGTRRAVGGALRLHVARVRAGEVHARAVRRREGAPQRGTAGARRMVITVEKGG